MAPSILRLRSSPTALTLAALVAATRCAAALHGVEPREIDYNRDIRPILAANCFQCHGPDRAARKAGLRLDVAEEAVRMRRDGAAIVPGSAQTSRVVARLRAEDPDERMPPPESKKTVTEAEITRIEAWIAQGAEYRPHWAFAPPERPAPPRVRAIERARNAIDLFAIAALEAAGLELAPEADRFTLARRVALDLVGLPPTPEEADAFARDERPDAYDRFVDRLLASPHYGERWARPWLDLARYSDTNGYEKDRPRPAWTYRDWVIDAFNADLSFDRFTVEQIAGDMLPGATAAQRVATGFHRNTMVNEEGGIDPQEFRFLALVDRVNTTGATWLGLTLACAQCHSHKYDPISQEEYYGLMALLDNADEVDMSVPDETIERERERIDAEVRAARGRLASVFPVPKHDGVAGGSSETDEERRRRHLEMRLAEWTREQSALAVRWNVVLPATVTTNLATVDVLEDDSVLASGDYTKNDIYDVTLDLGESTITALRLEALPHDSLPAGGPGRRVVGQGPSAGVGDFFLSEIRASVVPAAETDAGSPAREPLAWACATESFAAAERPASAAIDGKPDTGWSVSGRSGERHVAVFRFATPVRVAPGEALRVTLEHESFYPSGLGRFRLSVTDDPRDVAAWDLPPAVEAALRREPSERTVEELAELRQAFLLRAPELEDERKRIAKLEASRPELATALVMLERRPEHARVTHRRHRGEYLQRREAVTPGVPEALHPLPPAASPDRLALARWLVDERNPLTARVVVNRLWQQLFGRGLVGTTEDFGVQGEPPTHPELLDWLATELVRRGWSMKSIHRLVVTSATYRQEARVTAETLRRDPENALLSRGPRRRLDAELVRDTLLAASGLLDTRLGGPSVFPSQPPGITEAAYGPLKWELSAGGDRYRRGLYTFNKRTAPYAAYLLFDAPSGEACLTRRDATNTPLQALAMLNDEVTVDASRALARRALAEGHASDRDIATRLFRVCLTRPPGEPELRALLDYAASTRRRLDPRDAVAGAIAGPAAASLDDDARRALATWTLVARALFNLDELVMKP